MTHIQQLIYSNGNWRADAGKTAAEVAEEMNAARFELIPGSNKTLLGIAQSLGTPFTVQLQATVETVIPQVDTMTAIALKQYMQMLLIAPGINFGLLATQQAIEAMRPVLGDTLTDGLLSLGRRELFTEVTADDVQQEWNWYSEYTKREAMLHKVERSAQTLRSLLPDREAFWLEVGRLHAETGE